MTAVDERLGSKRIAFDSNHVERALAESSGLTCAADAFEGAALAESLERTSDVGLSHPTSEKSATAATRTRIVARTLVQVIPDDACPRQNAPAQKGYHFLMSFFARLLGLEPALRVRGIPVQVDNTRHDIRTEDVVARLDEALALIERYAPHRFAHLVRDARAIRIERYACRGAYFPADRTIMTELTFLARRDIGAETVASSILHEGVHARVHAFTDRVLRGRAMEWDMAREERLCRRAELAFGLALPPQMGAPVIDRARASLSLDDHDVAPRVDWREAEARIREVDGR